MWHSNAKATQKWPKQENYTAWCKKQNDMVDLFIEFSNTYKHTDRKAWFANVNLSLRVLQKQDVETMSGDEKRNAVADHYEDQLLFPLINANSARPIYYRYAALTVIDWWTQHATNFASQVSNVP